MAGLSVLRVFTDASGAHGNPLGVFADGPEVPPQARQGVARALGFSETVFVDDRAAAAIAIYTPEIELPFAGHPSVGTAWLLAHLGAPPGALRPPAGEVGVRFAEDGTWITARPEWSPPFAYVQLASPGEVDALGGAPAGEGAVFCWAWEDESAGLVRARCFVEDAGIPEDEATGSAALALCARLGRAIRVRQGAGSLIWARPASDGFVEIGGTVELDEVREWGEGTGKR